MMSRMLGRFCPYGPGGRDCQCCGQPPGLDRVTHRRHQKRRERKQWRTEAWQAAMYEAHFGDDLTDDE